MYQRENDFDQYFEKASAHVGLPVPMMKAIVAVESAFAPTVFNMMVGKVGLSGMRAEIAARVGKSMNLTEPGRVLQDPEANIMLLAFYLRFLYSNLANGNLFPQHGGHDPDYFDVVKQYARDNESAEDLTRYVEKVWMHYKYFAEKAGEPHSYRADEVEGTNIRKRQDMLL